MIVHHKNRRSEPEIILLTVFFFVVTGCAGYRLLHRGMRLEVAECDTGKVLLQEEVQPGAEFSIWFFHSYDRAFFKEHYRVVDKDKIVLNRLTFKSLLNGQGLVAGTYHAKPDGSAELSDIHQEFETVIFRLGSPDLANHTLVIDGRRLRLLDYTEAGTLICIRVQSNDE
jgi:hypothetical protein